MADNPDESELKVTESTKTKKNKSKLLTNMIMKAKEKIKSSHNEEKKFGSVTCLYENPNKSLTSQMSKNKLCDASDNSNCNLPKNAISQPNLQDVDASSKECLKFECLKANTKLPEPSQQSSLNKNDNASSLKDSNEYGAKNVGNILDQAPSLNRCTSMSFVTTAVKEILDFSQRLQSSEEHLLDILKKYVSDSKLEQELTEIVTTHITLQVKAERHAQILANDIWLQQAQFYKNQERVFNDTLKEILNQNKKLQEENEILTRKNDKIYVKMALATQDETSTCIHEQNSLHIIDHLNRSNERLRYKNNQLQQRVKGLENAVVEGKQHMSTVDKQLQNCFTEIQSQKRTSQSFKLDKELEVALLNHKVENGEKMFQNAIQYGEGVIEEMSVVKHKLSSIFSAIDWQNMRKSGNILQDIFLTCKIYLKEMTTCIKQMENNMKSLEESNEIHKSECSKLRDALNIASVEVETSIRQAEIYNLYADEKEKFIAKINALQTEVDRYEQIIQAQTKAALEERSKMVKMIEGLELLKIRITEKEEQLQRLRNENDGLRHQINGLNQVLQASGAGDVARELASAQEKLSALQSLYHQTIADKNDLVGKVSLYSSKIEVFGSNEITMTNKINDLDNEIKLLKERILQDKEEISAQKATINALQNERKRHLEEKNFLKTVYDRFKSDATKAGELESTLQVMSKETSRLTVIAEYNKKLGETLQKEIDERDTVISELQQNIKKLSEMQRFSVKEKAALCEELTDVCSFKDILSSKLEDEINKNVKMNESKKLLETNVTQQLESLKSLQNVERNAVKKLLVDFNEVVVEKNKLSNNEKELQAYLGKLEGQQEELQENLKVLKETNADNIEKIKSLEAKLNDEQNKVVTLKEDNEKLLLDEKSVRSENDKLRESVSYLKQNVQNLRSSTDESRTLQVQLRNETKLKNEELTAIKAELNDKSLILKGAQNENAILAERIENERTEHARILAEHLSFKNRSAETENLLHCKVNALQFDLEQSTQKVKHLKEQCEEVSGKCEKMEALVKKKDRICDKLTSENDKLEEIIKTLSKELDLSADKVTKMINEMEMTKQQVSILQEKHAQKERIYKKTLEELTLINQSEGDDFKEQIVSLKDELTLSKEKLQTEKKTYTQLEESHKDLAGKLLKAVHMLMDEKLAKQSVEMKVNQLTQELVRRETEQVGAEQKLHIYTERLTESAKTNEELSAKIKDLENEFKENLDRYRQQREEFEKLTNEHTNLEEMYKEQASKMAMLPPAVENEERIIGLKCEIDENHAYVMKLQNDIFKLQQEKTATEFDKSEVELHLHDVEKQLQMERDLKESLQILNERVLAAILDMKEKGSIGRGTCESLLEIMQNRINI